MMVPNKKTKAIFFSNKSNCLRKFQAFLLMERYVKRNILIEFATKLKKPHHRSIWGPSCPKKAKARTLSKQLHQIYSLYAAVTSQKYSEKKLIHHFGSLFGPKNPVQDFFPKQPFESMLCHYVVATSCKKIKSLNTLIFCRTRKANFGPMQCLLFAKKLQNKIFLKKII